ncbi:lipase family protein [Nocardia sp. CDC159]|uniref:Lipase family protein n=1 Tax=Nocardia pulmonis TaxID=2951408 RepID=A0A9X2E6P7_9NOCA|nr:MULTISPECIES: alpha/beta fold hydrolase [Nocardia]MCM6774799.1 lipase family protein [Nocardia pulmonis]MCM6789730.1 lipase family protein [Nocardia sp. CDC159]
MRSLAVLVVTLCCCTVVAFGEATADPLEAIERPVDGSLSPPGANDWQCAPRAAHPEPVVLVHGTWGNQNAWDVLAPELRTSGYCVFSLNYGRDTSSIWGARPGVYGTADIRASARELAAFVEKVRAATNSPRVDIVAHSQGGVVARQYLRFEGGANPSDPQRNKVHKVVMMAPTNHGTTALDWGHLLHLGSSDGPGDRMVGAVLGTAAAQQVIGSDFLHRLNAAGDTEPGVQYTVIATRVDEVTTPPESAFLRPGPGATVENLWVQSFCPADNTDHGRLPESPTVIRLVKHALDPSYQELSCAA